MGLEYFERKGAKMFNKSIELALYNLERERQGHASESGSIL